MFDYEVVSSFFTDYNRMTIYSVSVLSVLLVMYFISLLSSGLEPSKDSKGGIFRRFVIVAFFVFSTTILLKLISLGATGEYSSKWYVEPGDIYVNDFDVVLDGYDMVQDNKGLIDDKSGYTVYLGKDYDKELDDVLLVERTDVRNKEIKKKLDDINELLHAGERVRVFGSDISSVDNKDDYKLISLDRAEYLNYEVLDDDKESKFKLNFLSHDGKYVLNDNFVKQSNEFAVKPYHYNDDIFDNTIFSYKEKEDLDKKKSIIFSDKYDEYYMNNIQSHKDLVEIFSKYYIKDEKDYMLWDIVHIVKKDDNNYDVFLPKDFEEEYKEVGKKSDVEDSKIMGIIRHFDEVDDYPFGALLDFELENE